MGVSLPPGLGPLSGEPHPLAAGLQRLFPSLYSGAVVGIASIGALCTVTPWLYATNRQLYALSCKGLLPFIISKVWRGVPYVALAVSALFGYSVVAILTVYNHYLN